MKNILNGKEKLSDSQMSVILEELGKIRTGEIQHKLIMKTTEIVGLLNTLFSKDCPNWLWQFLGCIDNIPVRLYSGTIKFNIILNSDYNIGIEFNNDISDVIIYPNVIKKAQNVKILYTIFLDEF